MNTRKYIPPQMLIQNVNVQTSFLIGSITSANLDGVGIDIDFMETEEELRARDRNWNDSWGNDWGD